MNFCYALKLPKFESIVNDDINILDFISTRVPTNRTEKYLFYTNAKKIFKESFLTSFNINFSSCHCFYKPSSGGIHIDLGNYRPDKPEECWGINWNFGSPALYDYWNFEDIETVTHCLNEQRRPHTILKTSNIAKETYIHHQGPVLFNAAVPHRARLKSTTTRYAVSLRMEHPMVNWKDAVDMFKNIIVEDNSILEKL